MPVKRLLLFTVVLFFAVALLPASAQAKTHRVVFALTSGDEADWKLMVGNIRNLVAAFPPDSAEIEVVAYGPGLGFLRKGASPEVEIEALQAKRVRFVACENSMRMQKVTLADLVAKAQSVPSGVAEVVTRQEQGWSYIRAGR